MRLSISTGWLVVCLLVAGCGKESPGDTEPQTAEAGCESCHAPEGDDGQARGIEDAHPSQAMDCVDCHGGDAEAATQEEAHVAPPEGVEGPAQLRGMTSVELDAVDPAYLRWVNPTDYRVAELSCGGADCHQPIVETAPRSIMTTFAGHFSKTRYYAGSQDVRQALYGVRDQEAGSYEGLPGTVASLQTLVAPVLGETSSMGDYLDHYLEKGCPRCHVWNFGSNEDAGDFRSSGCAGCHMRYANDGLSRSADPTANLDDPPHPAEHTLTSSIPDEQCEHCHYRGNRIGTMYRGVREAGRLGDPENLEVSAEPLHTREPGFFVSDEDTTNDIDETPPDVHYSAGLGCVDCHMGVDVHGSDVLNSAHDYQVGVECEDCHGGPSAPLQPADDGSYRSTGGDEMRMLFELDGAPVMTGRLDGKTHEIPQLYDLQQGDNELLIEAHGTYESGFSHLDELECYTCHSAWTQSCFGCHVSVDTRYDGRSLIDGSETPGLTGGTRDWVVLDYLGLGIGVDGKITPMAPQEKMFVTVIAPCDPAAETCTESPDSENPGKRLFNEQVRVTHDGTWGMGYGPVVPHTTSATVQPCDRCHLREDGSNEDILRESFGWGSGRFVVPDGDGLMHDLTRVLDEETGLPTVGLAHEGTSTLSPEMIEGMLKVRVESSGLELKDFPEWEAP